MQKKKRELVILMLLCTISCFGQPGGGGDPGHGQPVPISGIEILIAMGAGLGIKKLLNSKGLDKSDK